MRSVRRIAPNYSQHYLVLKIMTWLLRGIIKGLNEQKSIMLKISSLNGMNISTGSKERNKQKSTDDDFLDFVHELD